MQLVTEVFSAPLGDETRPALNPNWRRAWFVDVGNRYAGHMSGFRVGFTRCPEPSGEWRCYAINCPCTVANDLPRLLDQAKKLFEAAEQNDERGD